VDLIWILVFTFVYLIDVSSGEAAAGPPEGSER